jgi:plasmid segregation protein ParM
MATGVHSFVLPAGAGPAELLPDSIGGNGHPDGGWRVPINGEMWAAGVEPGRLQGLPRDLHADYTRSVSYRALFLAALAATGAEQIGHLVTGLPVSHYKNGHAGLAQRLRGTHSIGGGVAVAVERVTVLPQPAGAYLDFINRIESLDLAERGQILVIDVGFFSVDWVLVDRGEIRHAASGTSLLAMSMVLKAADDLLRERHGCQVGVDRLELAVREGWPSFYAGGQRIATGELLSEAANLIAPRALAEMRQTLRGEHAVDGILVAGGGATLFEPHVAAIFPGTHIALPDLPVLANARGFWLLEQDL